MEKRLQQLRRFRNRVHIKTVEELEYSWYTPQLANGALDILEDFRLVAKAWIEARQRAAMVEALVHRAATVTLPRTVTPTPTYAVDDLVDHASLGSGIVVAAEGDICTVRFTDGSLRRLVAAYAPMKKTGVFAPNDDDIPF